MTPLTTAAINQSYDKPYDQKFFDRHLEGSLASAKAVLNKLFSVFQPESVVDFGCGRGGWLEVAGTLGSKVLKGFDGGWVDPATLLSPQIDFTPVDLAQHVQVARKYDMAISVEVAEHLPAGRATSFVADLCAASDVVLFGAAIKLQGGTDHLNERPQSYWVQLFKANGYDCFDIIRPAIWRDQRVEVWYRQNTFLFIRQSFEKIDRKELRAGEAGIVDIVHPELFEQIRNSILQPTFRGCVRMLQAYLQRKCQQVFQKKRRAPDF